MRDNLRFANWPLYIDYDEATKKYPTLDAFTADTGIKVDYTEEINDNAQYFGKIQGPLSQGRGIDRDIIVLTDNSRFPGLMIERGWAEKLNKDLIPNMSNLITAQQHPPFDPNREYSLPWQSGMTGIAWNEDVTGPVESVEQLLTDPALKGKVTMLMELADSVGLVMLSNGDDPSRSPTRPTTPRSTRSRAPSTAARSASSRATTTRSRSRRATSRPRSPGRATSCSSSRRTTSSSGRSRRRRDDLDGQHADPAGRLHRRRRPRT